MSSEKTEEKSSTREESSENGDIGARNVIEHQVQLTRDLKNEISRAERLQILTLGVLATALSVAGFGVFLDYTGPTFTGIEPYWFWFAGLAVLAGGLIMWISTYASPPEIRLSELELGVDESPTDCIKGNQERIGEWEENIDKYQRKLRLGLLFMVTGLLTFLI